MRVSGFLYLSNQFDYQHVSNQRYFLKIIKIAWLFVLGAMTGLGQSPCNRETKFRADSSALPKQVCLPDGYLVSYVYTRHRSIDFNHDNRDDCIFAIEKKTKTVGDSSFLFFYECVNDSLFVLVKKFDNVLPVYFDPNIDHPNLESMLLNEILDCYTIPDPLYSIEIKSDTVRLTQRMDGRDDELVQSDFIFSPSLKDWTLKNRIRSTANSKAVMAVNNETTLSKFSYCD